MSSESKEESLISKLPIDALNITKSFIQPVKKSLYLSITCGIYPIGTYLRVELTNQTEQKPNKIYKVDLCDIGTHKHIDLNNSLFPLYFSTHDSARDFLFNHLIFPVSCIDAPYAFFSLNNNTNTCCRRVDRIASYSKNDIESFLTIITNGWIQV